MGSATHWTPFRQRIGNSAAIWVPTARYSKRSHESRLTGRTYQPNANIAMLAAIAATTKIFAFHGRSRNCGTAGILVLGYRTSGGQKKKARQLQAGLSGNYES